jgi:ER degradation enhancer, mannosidase alpha-like 2
VKGAIMLNRPELLHMFEEGRFAIDKYLKRDDWHIWASMSKGQLTLPVFQSLQAFWPGLLSLLGDISSAMKSLHNMHNIWKQYGFLPEFYNIPNAEAGVNRDSYPLRPELIESVMYLYRATGDPYLLEVGEDILKSIQYSAKTSCGYATIKNVRDHRKQDTMESFFLAETTKYLYLLFDPDNFLNSDGGYGTVIETQNGECIIESSYIFNTEAHPIDVGALKCCHDLPRESLVKGFSRKKFQGEATATFDTKPETLDDVLEPKIEMQEVQESTEDFKKLIMNELFGASMKAKKKIEELQKRFEPMLRSREKEESFELKINVEKDSQETEDAENSTDVDKEPIEVVKIAPTLDSDNVDTQTKGADDSDAIRLDRRNEEIDNPPVIDSSREVKITKPSSDSNNSVLTDFVKTILKSTQRPKKFDPQMLIEKIRENKFPRNETWETKYELLTCKAQPYLQRISVMGEFY